MLTRFLYLRSMARLQPARHADRRARLRKGNAVLSIGWLAGVLLVGDAWALLTFARRTRSGCTRGWRSSSAALRALDARLERFRPGHLDDEHHCHGAVHRVRLPVTAFTPLNALSLILALAFFFIEALALAMAILHTYESLDAICRIRWRRRVERLEPARTTRRWSRCTCPLTASPRSGVQHPAHTRQAGLPQLRSAGDRQQHPRRGELARPGSAMPQLGARFRFMHLTTWPATNPGR